jgi:hypothetical protein
MRLKSESLPEEPPDVALSMQHSNDLKRCCVWSVNDCVVGIARQRPETDRERREVGSVGSGVAPLRARGKEGASVINGLFYPVGCGFAVFCDMYPNVEISVFATGVRTYAVIQ